MLTLKPRLIALILLLGLLGHLYVLQMYTPVAHWLLLTITIGGFYLVYFVYRQMRIKAKKR